MKRSIPWVPVALAGLAIVAFFVLDLLVAGGGSRDYDEGVYWQALRSLNAGHQLFKEIFAPQGPAFFYGLLPFYDAFGHSIDAARIGIAVYSVIAALAIFLAATAVAGRWAGAIAAALLVSDPIWAAESQTLHAEIPALAWGLIALALATWASQSGKPNNRAALAAAAGAALALGMATKAFVIVFAVPVIWYLGAGTRRSSIRPYLFGMAGFALAGLAVFAPFLPEARAVFDDLIGLRLSASRALSQGVGYNIGLLHLGRELPLELGTIAVVIAGALMRDRGILPGSAWIVVTVLALIAYQPLFPHELALLIPPFAFTGAIAAVRLATAPDRELLARASTLEAGLAAAVLLIAGVATVRDVTASRDLARPDAHDELIAAQLRQVTSPSDLIVGDNPYAIALANRDCPPQLVDTSFARIVSGFLTATRIESIAREHNVRAFLFDSGRLDAAPGLRAWVAENYPNAVEVGGALYFFQR